MLSNRHFFVKRPYYKYKNSISDKFRLLYCKSGYIHNIFIFSIFCESIASRIYKSAECIICNIQAYSKTLRREFIKQNISRKGFSRSKDHANIKRFTVYLMIRFIKLYSFQIHVEVVKSLQLIIKYWTEIL